MPKVFGKLAGKAKYFIILLLLLLPYLQPNNSFAQFVATACDADVNRDTKVNSTDLLIVSKHQGEVLTAANAAYDVNHDGKINSTDLLVVSKLQGQICSTPLPLPPPLNTQPPPNPTPCFNPVATDNLTDNYITDGSGDPPGPEGKNNPEALKFTFTATAAIGSIPDLRKTMTFSADFSKLQAIFGAPTSDYLEGRYQNPQHAQANLLAMQNPELIKHQGPEGKLAPSAITNDLRQKYVTYVNQKPEIAESKQSYSDYNGQNPKNIHDLVSAFGAPSPPSPTADRTSWINTWGKYWENIPTTYNEFYIGKLEFRPVHGKTAIQALKNGTPGACFPNAAVRTVEFPVPNFFRSAATSGVLNQVILPRSAWSDQNDLLGIQGAVKGIKTSTFDFIKNCFKFASNNPVTNAVKKVIKISLENINPATPVYAINQATNLSTSQSGCGTTGKVSATLSWTRADDPSGSLPIQDQEMEISLSSGFAASVTQTVALTATQSSRSFTDFFLSNTDYWWRVHTQYFGVWTTGDTIASFHSITCAPPAPACVFSPTTITAGNTVGIITNNFTIDPIPVNLVGTVFANIISVGNIPKTGGSITVPLSTAGDYEVRLGNTGATTTCTGTLTVTAPANSGNNKATPISVNQTGCAINPTTGTQMVSATFTWTPADNPVVVNGSSLPVLAQFLDYSVFNNGWVDLTFQGQDVGVGSSTYTFTGFFAPNIDYYWRVNTNYYPGGIAAWSPSATATFKTIVCAAGNNKATPISVNQTGCALNIAGNMMVTATFTWTPADNPVIVAGASLPVLAQFLDYSVFNNGWVDLTFQGQDVGVGSSTYTFTGFFAPNIDYYWRVNTNYYPGGIAAWSPSATATFKTITCANPKDTWTVFDLNEKSCIKAGKTGKSGNAPFCAIYPTKFEPAVKGQTNVSAGECSEPSKSFFKLNDQTNVVCNLSFEWKSSDYNGTDKSLVIPATGDGNWDSCDPPAGTTRTCYLTVGVWPDFRVPYLGQIWNNSLYSDTNEYLPNKQVTGQPGVYSLLQPKALTDFTKQDPQAIFLQGLVDKCKADPPLASDPGKLRGCGDLANWATTGGNANQYPGLQTCVEQFMFTNQPAMTTCLSLVTITIIESLKKLPGEVNSGTLGVNTGGGSVLGTNAGNQKERLIGAVDCGKHFSRDIALKPKVLQQSLGIQQDCTLTSSAPPTGTPITPPTASPPPPPPGGSCSIPPTAGNFGDACGDFSISALDAYIKSVDPTNAATWMAIVPLESSFNPNATAVAVNGTAYGLLQMDSGLNGQFDNGQVNWKDQVSNAVAYNNNLAVKWCYWGSAYPPAPTHPNSLGLVTYAQCGISPF
jgi:hypothetical protein